MNSHGKVVGVVDYGAGNVQNVLRAFEHLGYGAELVETPVDLTRVSHVVIPGVGSFRFGMDRLERSGFVQTIQDLALTGTPILGICLGMQLMATKGFEHGETLGLGLFEGEVLPLKEASKPESGARTPHAGWTQVEVLFDTPQSLVTSGDYYFSHSFHFVPRNKLSTVTSEYSRDGKRITASIEQENKFGLQFHPEKSGELGLLALQKFASIA